MTSVRAAGTPSALQSMCVYPFEKNPRARCCLLQKLFRSGCATTGLPYVNRACLSPPALNRRSRCYRLLAEGHNIPAARPARTPLGTAPSLVDCAHSAGGVDEANCSRRREPNRQDAFLLGELWGRQR